MDRAELIAAMQVTAAEVKPKPVQTPWGLLYVRSLTVGEVDANNQADRESKDKRTLSRGVARVICNEAGARIFDASNDDDVTLIDKQPYAKLQSIIAAANAENATSQEAQVEQGNG